MGIRTLWGSANIREIQMSGINDREKAFENKYAHDQELKFRVESRRNKLLGLWAAALLGKAGDDADAYAKDVVVSDFEEAGDDDVFRKIRADFDAAGITTTDEAIRTQMQALLAEAMIQIQNS